MRTQVANWFARRMGLPYLESHYIRFFRNGGAHGSVGEDLEQPSNDYAEGWFPLYNGGKVFNLTIGAGVGVFYFAEGPTYGGTAKEDLVLCDRIILVKKP
jgi:hypothetical protein